MKVLKFAAIVIFAAAMQTIELPAISAAPSPTIQAEGHGEVRAPADTLVLTIAIDTPAPTASEATQKNTTDVAKVRSVLAQTLNGSGSIAQSNFYMNPVYGPPTESAPSGFEAYAQIQARYPKGMYPSEKTAAVLDEILPEVTRFQGALDEGNIQGMSLEVITFATTATEAVRLNDAKTAKIVATLKKRLGNGAKVTTDSSVSPGTDQSANQGATRTPKPSGFTAHSELLIESKEMDLLPDLATRAQGIAGVRLQSVQFLLRDRAQAQEKAIGEATRDAESKAKAAAAALNVKLGALINSSVDVQPNASRATSEVGAGAIGGAIAPAAQVRPQDVDVSARVVLTYAIQ